MAINFRVVIISVFILAACAPNNSVNSGKLAVVARVNGIAVSQRQIDMVVSQQGEMRNIPQARKMAIESIATDVIAAQEAIKNGLDKTPDVVAQIGVAQQTVLAHLYVQDYFAHSTVSDTELAAEYAQFKNQATAAVPPLEQVKAGLIKRVKQQKLKTIVEQMKLNAKIVIILAPVVASDPVSK